MLHVNQRRYSTRHRDNSSVSHGSVCGERRQKYGLLTRQRAGLYSSFRLPALLHKYSVVSHSHSFSLIPEHNVGTSLEYKLTLSNVASITLATSSFMTSLAWSFQRLLLRPWRIASRRSWIWLCFCCARRPCRGIRGSGSLAKGSRLNICETF